MTLPNFGEPESDDTLDRFLGQCLHIAGVWSSPRVGDGIARVRVMERTPDRVRLLGLIWLAESQLQEPFWLDLAEAAGGRFAWTLHFGLVSLAGRSHRDLLHAVDLIEAPEQGTWRVVLDGKAKIEGCEVGRVELTASRHLSGDAI